MKKSISLTVNDKEYKIRFNMNSIIELEDLLGKGIAEIKGESFREVRAMIYVSITPRFKTVEQAGDFIDTCIETIGLEALMKKVAEAVELSLGK